MIGYTSGKNCKRNFLLHLTSAKPHFQHYQVSAHNNEKHRGSYYRRNSQALEGERRMARADKTRG